MLTQERPKPVTCHHLCWPHMTKRVEAIVEHYHDDFYVIDRDHLAALPINTPLVWSVRNCGTHIWTQHSVTAGKASGWKNHQDAARQGAIESKETWHYDGLAWKQITPDAAFEIVKAWEDAAPDETPENQKARFARGGW